MKSREKIIVVGAGGHSRSILDIFLSNGEYLIYGILDRSADAKGLYGIPLLGGEELMETIYAEGIRKAFVAIGDNFFRERNFLRLKQIGFDFVNAISERAYISDRAVIGRGIAVMHGAVVNAGARIGDGVIINTLAGADHDSIIEDFAHIAPGAALCGEVTVGRGAFVCAGVTVVQRINIGANSIIGAGASVIRDVPDNATFVGVPAVPISFT